MKQSILAALGALFLLCPAARGATIDVTIASNQFTNSDITINVGDTVRWTWVSGQHSTTSDTGLWNSDLQAPPFVFPFTFLTAGNYPYYCTLHGLPGGIGMSGIVRVQTPTPTPSPTPTPTITRTPTLTPIPTPQAFHDATPCRVVDTRNAPGPVGGPALQAGAERLFPFAGQCGIPVTAKSVSINVTVTASTGPGHLTIYPAGQSAPLASSLNFQTGQTRANNALVVLGIGGQLAVFCGQASGTTHFIADINGWFE